MATLINKVSYNAIKKNKKLLDSISDKNEEPEEKKF